MKKVTVLRLKVFRVSCHRKGKKGRKICLVNEKKKERINLERKKIRIVTY